MTTTDRIKQAEQDGMTITLDPSELGELNDEIQQLRQNYIEAAAHRDKVRCVAVEARDALRLHNHGGSLVDRLTRVCRGDEV